MKRGEMMIGTLLRQMKGHTQNCSKLGIRAYDQRLERQSHSVLRSCFRGRMAVADSEMMSEEGRSWTLESICMLLNI